jgi:hypothetical protein
MRDMQYLHTSQFFVVLLLFSIIRILGWPCYCAANQLCIRKFAWAVYAHSSFRQAGTYFAARKTQSVTLAWADRLLDGSAFFWCVFLVPFMLGWIGGSHFLRRTSWPRWPKRFCGAQAQPCVERTQERSAKMIFTQSRTLFSICNSWRVSRTSICLNFHTKSDPLRYMFCVWNEQRLLQNIGWFNFWCKNAVNHILDVHFSHFRIFLLFDRQRWQFWHTSVRWS